MSEINQTEQFLKDIEVKEDDILTKPLFEENLEKDKNKEEEGEGFKAKNRRETRLLKQNQRLREEAIATQVRLQTIQESQNIRDTATEAEYLKRIERIYGTATPEAKEATELLKEALEGLKKTTKDEAREEALAQIRADREQESRAVRQEEETLDEILEDVEDEYGIDMSLKEDKNGFLNLLEKLSPKDKEGNIVEFADPYSTAELYLQQREKKNTRAKEISSRSMVRGGNSVSADTQQTALERLLKEEGII